MFIACIFSLVGSLFVLVLSYFPLTEVSHDAELQKMRSSLCYSTAAVLFRTCVSYSLVTQIATGTFGLIISLPVDPGHLKQCPQLSWLCARLEVSNRVLPLSVIPCSLNTHPQMPWACNYRSYRRYAVTNLQFLVAVNWLIVVADRSSFTPLSTPAQLI